MSFNRTLRQEHTNIAAAAGAATVINNDVTHEGVESIWCALFLGIVTVAGGTPALRVFQSKIGDFSDAVEVTTLKTLFVDTTQNNGYLLVELVRPTAKGVRFQIDRSGNAGNSIAINGGVIVKEYGRKLPVALTAKSRLVAIGT